MVPTANLSSDGKDAFNAPANGFMPVRAVVPLEQECPAECTVGVGDRVEEGQVIARGRSSCVHASVPGTVEDISVCQYSNGRQGLAATVALSGAFSFSGRKLEKNDWWMYDSASLAAMLRNAGVLNTFSGGVPLYDGVRAVSHRAGRTLAVRLFDDDPGRAVEGFVARRLFQKVLEGASVIAKATDTTQVLFAYERHSPFKFEYAHDHFDSGVALYQVAVDTRRYPAGTMHDIVAAARRAHRDKFRTFGTGDLFIDSLTALHAHDAVVYGKPVIDRYVHVAGGCLNASAILNVKIGTTFRMLVEQCGGFREQPGQVVVNGIMTGLAVGSLDIPVSKDVKSVSFLPARAAPAPHTEPCIRCGLCRKACPLHLWPGNIRHVFRAGLDEPSVLNAAILCTGCGLCNAVCPSRIALSQTLSLIKETVHEKQR